MVSAPGEGLIDHHTFRDAARHYLDRLSRDRRRDRRCDSRTWRRTIRSVLAMALAYGSIRSLVGLKRWPGFRIIRSMHAIAIMLSWPCLREIDMPDLLGAFFEAEDGGTPAASPCASKRHNSTAGGIFGKEREVDSFTVPRRAKRIGSARPCDHRLTAWLCCNNSSFTRRSASSQSSTSRPSSRPRASNNSYALRATRALNSSVLNPEVKGVVVTRASSGTISFANLRIGRGLILPHDRRRAFRLHFQIRFCAFFGHHLLLHPTQSRASLCGKRW